MRWWRAALAALAALSLSAVTGAGTGAGAEAESGAESAAESGAGSEAGARRSGVAAQVERRLLDLLGLERRPRPDRARVAVPDAMRALYDHFAAGMPFVGQRQRAANTVRSYTHQESPVDDRFKSHHKFRLMFNMSVPEEETLNAAELVISRDSLRFGRGAAGNASSERHRVAVYDIVKPGVKGVSAPSLRLLDRKWVRVERAGAVTLDVSSAAERWAWRPRDNHGLLVHVAEAGGGPAGGRHVRLRRSAADSRESWRARQPVLLAYTDDRRTRRGPASSTSSTSSTSATAPTRNSRAVKRGARTQRRKSNRDICQRRSLYVNFTEVGWNDWIVAPAGYEAYYCHGECPFPLGDHLNSTNHAIVQTLVNSVSPKAMPKVCCVPTDLSTVSLLYTEDEKVVLKHYQDMSVVGCGCR